MWVPPGTFLVTAIVTLDNVTLVGAGPWWSVLRGAGFGLAGLRPPSTSTNVQVRWLGGGIRVAAGWDVCV